MLVLAMLIFLNASYCFLVLFVVTVDESRTTSTETFLLIANMIPAGTTKAITNEIMISIRLLVVTNHSKSSFVMLLLLFSCALIGITIVSISIIDVRFLEAQLLKGARVQLVETSFPRPNGGQSRLEGMCRGCQMLRGFGSLTPCCRV